MVSVVIPEYEDDLYLIRCLNSIKRQTYKETEIILINGNCDKEIIDKYNLKVVETTDENDNGLNKAIEIANGEYVFFCSVSTVLASNVLEEFLKEDKDTFVYAEGYVAESDGFVERIGTMFSCYGKLFNKSTLQENRIKFAGNSILSETLFVVGYISCLKNVKCRKDIYMYETDSEVSEICDGICIDISEWQEYFNVIKNTAMKIRNKLRERIIKIVKENTVYSEELAFLAERESHADYELNYLCAVPVLKQFWNNILEEDDEESVEKFRTYLSKYEKEEFVYFLLSACGLKKEDYEYIKKNTRNNFLFLIRERDKLEFEKDKLLETVDEISKNQSSGLVKIGSKWYYHSNGKLDRSYEGMAENQYGWWYVSNGTIDYGYRGLSRNPYGWWYISNGTVDKKYTGLVMNTSGIWMYVQEGAVNRDFAGLINTKSGYKYITDGILNREYVGLVKDDATGKWIYIENGVVNNSFIGLARNDYGWWYVEDGTINFQYNGYAPNYMGWCRVENGKAQPETISEREPEYRPETQTRNKPAAAITENAIHISEENTDVLKNVIETGEKGQENPSEITVDFYRNGQLGFRTIVSSMGAWMKYKLKR